MPDAARLPTELTLRGLRVFVALEEAGSIAGAAQRIGGSSSGVSQHITVLEAAIGAKLFDRRAKPVTLTPRRAGAARPCPPHPIGRVRGAGRTCRNQPNQLAETEPCDH